MAKKYQEVFKAHLADILDRFPPNGLERLVNRLYSSDLIDHQLQDDVTSPQGVSTYHRLSKIMGYLDQKLRSQSELEVARCIVLKVCKALHQTATSVIESTLESIMRRLKEVPEVVVLSLLSSEIMSIFSDNKDSTETQYLLITLKAEEIIPEVPNIQTPIMNGEAVCVMIIKSIEKAPDKFINLVELFKKQPRWELRDLAIKLEKELSGNRLVELSRAALQSCDVQPTEANSSAIKTPRLRISSEVERNLTDLFSKYEHLIRKFEELFRNAASEHNNDACELNNVKKVLKRSTWHEANAHEIETYDSIEEIINFSAKKNTSLSNVQYLYWLGERFHIPASEPIEDYKSELKRFIADNKRDLFDNMNISSANFTRGETIEFTIRKDLNKTSLFQIEQVIEEIFEEMKIYITVKVVRKTRSITIVCYAPEPIIGFLIRKVQKNLKTLQEKGLMSMKIGYCTLLDFENDQVAVAREIEGSIADVLCSDTEGTQEELSLASDKMVESLKESEQLAKEKEQYYLSRIEQLEQQLEAKSFTPEKQTGLIFCYTSTNELQDESQGRYTTEEFEKLRLEKEKLEAERRRHEDLTAIIQKRKQENETLQKIIEERNKEIETLQKKLEELDAPVGGVVSPTSEADKRQDKEKKQEDTKLVEDELKRSSEDQLQYEQNIENLKIKELEEKIEFLDKEKERGRSELESVQEQLKETKETLETVKEMRRKLLRENEQQKDKIRDHKETIQKNEEELDAKNEEYQKLDADVAALTKEKDEIQQLKDDVEKKMSETEKQNDDLRVECQELQTSSIKLKGEYDTLQGEFSKRPPTLAFYNPSHTHYVPVTMVMTNFNDYKKNNIQWFSPGFYTRPEGYKLCVKVDAHGRKSGQGTHISVYVHVMQGEYDDRLTWPFTAKVQLELLNRQADENHRMITVEFNDSSDIVSRSRIMGAGIITDSGSLAREGEGEDCLISHGDLGYNSSTFTEFLKDDSIYIRVKSVDIQMATGIPPSPIPLHTTYPTDKFTLKEFSKLKAKNKEWPSDPFYTHEKGYKFVLVVQPNGEYTYKGRYIAMFLHITRGEYDDQLVFPFRGNIYVHLVNQIDDQNHSEFVVKYDEESDPRGKHGGRVSRFNFGERSSEGWGTASLIRHDLLPYNKYRGTKYLTDNDEIEFRIHKIEVFSG